MKKSTKKSIDYYMYELLCRCGNKLFKYKKENDDPSDHCLLRQMHDPKKIKEFQYNAKNKNPNCLRLLICKNCHFMVGTPVLYEGELGFLLRPKFFDERKIGV